MKKFLLIPVTCLLAIWLCGCDGNIYELGEYPVTQMNFEKLYLLVEKNVSEFYPQAKLIPRENRQIFIEGADDPWFSINLGYKSPDIVSIWTLQQSWWRYKSAYPHFARQLKEDIKEAANSSIETTD